MKTNQIMRRPFMGGEVLQRTSDGYFNLTELAKLYAQYREDNPHLELPSKPLAEYMRNDKTRELIAGLSADENILLMYKSTEVEFNPIKSSNASRGQNAGTWACAEMFIDFAMWLSMDFRIRVLGFVRDNLIAFRHAAGDNYTRLNLAMQANFERCERHHYINVSRLINTLVFGSPESEQRNNATDAQLDEVARVESTIVDAIEGGLIADYYGIKDFVNRLIERKAKQQDND